MKFSRENKLFIGVVLVLLIFIVKLNYDFNLKPKVQEFSNLEEVTDLTSIEQSNTIDENSIIYVHVSGRVKAPGLIELKSGSRVIDAVKAAGGMYDDADINNINLAKILNDEDRVYIPQVGEINTSTNSSQKIININIASFEELQTLPGIGEKSAKRIIDYREKNNFKTIEDIKNVPGFGEKKFEELKNYISVN